MIRDLNPVETAIAWILAFIGAALFVWCLLDEEWVWMSVAAIGMCLCLYAAWPSRKEMGE